MPTTIEIKDINRAKFKADKNLFLDDCYQQIKKIELKTNHGSDDSAKRTRTFLLNNIHHTIELLKRCEGCF